MANLSYLETVLHVLNPRPIAVTFAEEDVAN